jgi:PadR family transcriptional regulator AphA
VPQTGSASPKPVLLGLLMSGPKHGYDLFQQYENELGDVWQIGRSQLYALLKQLEEANLVTVETELQANRPARKVYSLTADGRQAFLAWVQAPSPYLRYLRVEFLARLYFYQQLDLPGLRQLVTEQQSVCLAQVERFAGRAAAVGNDYQRLVLEFRAGQLNAVVAWLDRCLEAAG